MTAFFPQQVQGFPSISWQLICGWFPADVQTLEYHVVPMLSKWAHTSLMLFLFLEPDSSMSTDSPKTSPTWHLPVVFCGIYRATHWNLAQVVSEKYFNFGNLWEDSTWSTMVLRVESSRLIQDLEETLNPPSKVGVLVVWTVDICFFLMDERYERGLRDKGIANTKDVSSIRSDVDRGGRCDEWSHVSQDQLHFTWPKRGLTCFYPICQFPYTRKTNLKGFPFPRPPRNKQNDKHTHSQKQKVILDTVIKKTTFEAFEHFNFTRARLVFSSSKLKLTAVWPSSEGLELEVAWWNLGNLEAHHVSIRGADVFRQMGGDPPFLWREKVALFLKGSTTKKHGNRGKMGVSWKKRLVLGRGW